MGSLRHNQDLHEWRKNSKLFVEQVKENLDKKQIGNESMINTPRLQPRPETEKIAGGSRTILKGIMTGLENALGVSGDCAGLDDPITIAVKLMEIKRKIKLANSWINRFMTMNKIPEPLWMDDTCNKVVVESRASVGGRVSEQSERRKTLMTDAALRAINSKNELLQHRDDCAKIMFATACNCGVQCAIDGTEPGYYNNHGVWVDGFPQETATLGYDPLKMEFTAEIVKPGFTFEPNDKIDIKDDAQQETMR